MSIYVPPVHKAGPVGPGAGVLNTEFLLPMMLPTDHAQRMGQAVKLGTEVAYVRAAERVIGGKFSTVKWHLEDPDGATIDDEYKDARALEAVTLLSEPMGALDVKEVGSKMTRRQMWEITSRHMGLAGVGAWYLDALNDFGIPRSIIYVRPDRLTPKYRDGRTALDHWMLDRRPGNEGTRLELDEIRLFVLETPNEGVFPPGLVESALTKALLNGQIDKHFAQVLQGGGRLAGILAPKTGAIEDDGIYNQLVRDWRNITEQPESARRLQVTRAPVDFIRTAATMAEMQIIDLMTKNRDDLLALWGVPLSQVGGATAAGLNSGDVRKYDEAALWQNAVHPRLEELAEGIQPLLDRFEAYCGFAPKLILEEPEFDDDSPRYDKVQKSQFIALTNDERRGQLGFDPLDEALIGPTGIPLGQEIWTGIGMMPVGKPPMATPTFTAKQIPTPAWSADAGSIAAVPGGQGAGVVKEVAAPVKAKPDPAMVTEAVMAALRKQWSESELVIVRQGEWTFDPGFPMKKINAARRPIARNPKIVAGVQSTLEIGAPIDPITIIATKRIGKPGYEPIDGWHRVLAAQHAGLKKIPAYVGRGGDAWTTSIIAYDDQIPTPPDDAGQAVKASAGQAIKAALPGYQQSFVTLRSNVEARHVPPLRSAVSRVLEAQKRDIIARVQGQYEAIKRKPGDTTLWWTNPAAKDQQMVAAIHPSLGAVVASVRGQVVPMLRPEPAKADPISALATSIAALAARENPAPVINVTPQVHVPAAAVSVTVPAAKAVRKIVKRDKDGNITEVREEQA